MGKTIGNKTYKNAPLPFMGQKRNFLKEFRRALKSYPDNAVYVDLFGGSGLLSHTVKRFYPDAKVVYNDYDQYSRRLREEYRQNKRAVGEIKTLTGQCTKGQKTASGT